MREERIDVGDLPAKLYRPPGAAAVLLLGHGGGHSKDSPRFERLARRYADETGLAVVCIDAVDHGERQPTGTRGNIPSGWHSRTINRMVEDWQATATALEAIGPAIAYVGFSMGAIFGFRPSQRCQRSGRLCSSREAYRAAAVSTTLASDRSSLTPPQRSTTARCSCLNKTGDEIFPAHDVQVTFDAVPGTTKELLFWEGDHNDWPPDLIACSVAFLQQHLETG